MSRWCADFETIEERDEEKVRVWSWCASEIENTDNIYRGLDIESFMQWLKHRQGETVYFHNLQYDGGYIVDWLLKNGWEWRQDNQDFVPGVFTSLISDMNVWYCLKLYWGGKPVEILDSLKVIPLKIAAIPKAFGLPIAKGEIDYKRYREVGYEPTPEEWDYIEHDVRIDAMAMDVMLKQGLTKMTAGSNALHTYIDMMGGKKRFRKVFPIIDCDEELRQAYRGGFTYASDKYKGRCIGHGIGFDVNSLYPSVMAATDGQLLPFGEPIHYDGEYETDELYPLFIQRIRVSFRIKPDHIPTIQIHKSPLHNPREYAKDSKGIVELTLTSVDLELMFQQYEIDFYEPLDGWKFRASRTLFKKYVEYWNEVKMKARAEGNEGMATLAKLMLNSLYGKFATKTVAASKQPVLDETGKVKYVLLPEDTKESVYLPVGCFITAWARHKTINACQANYDRFAYCDTDSCKLVGFSKPVGMEIDPLKLGAWKFESVYEEQKYLGAKCYMCQELDWAVDDRKPSIHVAGMPDSCHEYVTFDNFKVGSIYPGKLKRKTVNGGVLLVEGEHTIKERMF